MDTYGYTVKIEDPDAYLVKDSRSGWIPVHSKDSRFGSIKELESEPCYVVGTVFIKSKRIREMKSRWSNLELSMP